MKKAVQLYRNILKQHKMKLPPQMRTLGDAYVKNEFHLHKKTTSPAHLEQFMSGWDDYLQTIRGKENNFGKHITEDEARNLSEEQRAKLVELREEASQAKGGSS